MDRRWECRKGNEKGEGRNDKGRGQKVEEKREVDKTYATVAIIEYPKRR